MRRGLRRSLIGPLVLAAAWAAASCGGGGGGGGTPGPTQPTPSIIFTPAGPAGAGSLSLAPGPGTTATVLELQVRVTQVTNLYGVAFDLTYPTAVLDFDAPVEGTFLAMPGAGQTSLQVVEATPGRLVVGLTRLGALAGASGSGNLVSLSFTAVAAGSQPIAFAQNTAYDSTGQAQALSWVAGSVTVVR